MTKIYIKKTALEIAKKEFADEQREEAVKQLKVKLKELGKAKLIVENIERELEDLSARIEQGDTF